MKEQVKEAMDELLDIFGGGDGGIKFIKLKQVMEQAANGVAKGDKSSIIIVNRFLEFNSLLDSIFTILDEVSGEQKERHI